MPTGSQEQSSRSNWRSASKHAVLFSAFLLCAFSASADGTDDLHDRLSFCVTTEFYEVDSCYHRLKDVAEEEMVNAYLAAKSALDELDSRENPSTPSAQLLQDAQVAFEAYRKIHCDWPSRFTNGMEGVQEEMTCMTEMTLARIGQLRRLAPTIPPRK